MLSNYPKTCHVPVVVLFLLVIAFPSATAFANPVQNANKVIRLFTRKAHDCVQKGVSPHSNDNVTSAYQHKVDNRILELRILKPIDDDPFIDAYVRWRLSGFDINFPDMTDHAFQKFLEQLPPYVENPRANKQYCDAVASASADDRPLNRPEVVSLKNRIEDVGKQYKAARSRNTPTDQFRLWVMEQLEDNPQRLALAHLERLAAVVSAGWSSGSVFANAQKTFIEIGKNNGISASDLVYLEKIASRIAGINRLTLQGVEISFEGHINPHWSSAAIDDYALKRLLRLLENTEESTDGFLGRDRNPPEQSNSPEPNPSLPSTTTP